MMNRTNTFFSWIPNLLSLGRLCLACLFPFVPERIWIWFILYGGASDFLDGWIARRWNLSSWQGGIIDAVADKLFVLSVLVTFAWSGKFFLWWIPLVIVRDLSVAFIAGYAVYIRAWDAFTKMDARWSGKIATLGQFLLMVVVVVVPKFTVPVLYLVVLISFIAASDYAKEFVRALVSRAKSKAEKQ